MRIFNSYLILKVVFVRKYIRKHRKIITKRITDSTYPEVLFLKSILVVGIYKQYLKST